MPGKVNGRRSGGVYYDATVHAGASSESIVVSGDTLRIQVREKPERGAANRAVVRLVAKRFGVDATHVRIVRGLRGKRKLIKVSMK
jgi:uncharacterized protein YggU (UPF0235/DUF167 family)